MKKLIFTCFFLLICIHSFSQTEWKLKKDTNAIKIFTRSLPNESFDEYKAQTVIDNPIEGILNELLTAPKYFENCPSGVSYYVKQLNDNQHVFYAHKDLPWPLKDRDLVTLLTVNKISDKKYKLTLESLPNVIPEKEKTLRIKKLMGFWLLEEIDKKTKVTQQLFVNPEGSLPKFVVNSLLVKGPYKTFSDLRNVLTPK